MGKIGKLVLWGDKNKLIYTPKTEGEGQQYKQKFGWMNPDYRQSVLQDSSKAIAMPEDFHPFEFRHISATIVGAYSWKATEFTEKVLKQAVKDKLLDFKPSYVNHELEVGNAVGVLGESRFDPAYRNASGEIIPAGINAPIWIDKVLRTDLCRMLTGYPVPTIQSVSITVYYEWDPSHTFTDHSGNEDEYLFEGRIGQMVDGRMVRRIVTKIIDIYESSLVWLGADPIAKILDDKGRPINVEKTAIVGTENFSADPLSEIYKEHNVFFVNDVSFSRQNVLDLRNSYTVKTQESGNKNKDAMEKIVETVAKFLNKQPADVTEADIAGIQLAKKSDYDALVARDAAATENITKLKNEITELNTTVTGQKGTIEKYSGIVPADKLDELETSLGLKNVVNLANSGKARLDADRKEAVRLYKLNVKEADQSEAIVKAIESADEAQVEGYLKQYGSGASARYGAKCSKCDSADHITYKQSVETEAPEGVAKKEPGTDHLIDAFI